MAVRPRNDDDDDTPEPLGPPTAAEAAAGSGAGRELALPDGFLEAVAERVTQPDSDGMYPDPQAVVTLMGEEYGLTPAQIEYAWSLTGTFQDAVREETAQGEDAADVPDADEALDMFYKMADDPELARRELEQRREAANIADRYEEKYAESVEAAAARAASALLAAENPGSTNLDYITNLTPAWVNEEDRDAWAQAVRDQAISSATTQRADQIAAETGASTEEAQALAEGQLGSGFGSFQEPQWMLNLLGAPMTDAQRASFVDYWNDNYGTTFRSFKDLIESGSLDEQSAAAQYIAESAIADTEPIMQFRVELPGRGSTTLTQEEMEILRSTYGMSNDAITRTIRLAAQRGDVDASDIDVFGLAALARYYGIAGRTDDLGSSGIATGPGALGEAEKNEARITELDALVDSLTSQLDHVAPSEQGPILERRAEAIRELNALRLRSQGPGSGAAGADPSGTGSLSRYAFATGQGVGALADRFRRGLDLYRNNQTLAVIHSIDPALASRIAASGGDPSKLDAGDNADAYDVLIRAGVVQRDKRSGFRPDDFIANQFQSYFAVGQNGSGGSGGGGGSTRRLVDPVSVSAQVEALYRALYREAPPAGYADGITKALQAQLDASDPGMSFDVSSRIRSAITAGNPMYSTFFGQKPAGMSEEDYVGLMESGATSILGNEGIAADRSIRAGLATGDYQAAVGSAAGSKAAKNSSRWMERLALASNKFADLT